MPRKNKPDEKKPSEKENVDAGASGGDARPKLPFDITKIDPEKIRLAEEMGIPIGKMLEWIVHTEQRLDIIIKNMPNQKNIEKAMNDALINITRQRSGQGGGQPERSGGDGQPQGGQRSGSMIEQILMKALLGGGGGGDEEMLKIQKEIMQMSLSRMKSDISFTDEIKKAIVVNIASKAAKKVID